MFEKITAFLDERLSGPMTRLAGQRHLQAVRDGIIGTLPIIVISSMLMVFAFSWQWLPESWGLTIWIKANAGNILLPYRMSMYIMTMYAVFGFGYSLADSYDLDGLTGGILAELAFLLTIVPTNLPSISNEILQLVNGTEPLVNLVNGLPSGGGFHMPMGNLGSSGMFVGIIVSIFAVEVYRFTNNSNFKISMPEQVPPSVARSFEALTPTAIVFFTISFITMWLKFDIHSFIFGLVKPLISLTDSLPAVIVLTIISKFFWSFGIHGGSIVGSLARPLWLSLLASNTAALASSEVIPHIAAEPFYQWFVDIGGSGATLGLAILFVYKSKSKFGKTLGKTSIVPSIFNINEPMVFGAPIVLNPMLMIPFVIIPIVNASITWVCMSLNLVNRVTTSPSWVLPGPIGAFLATNGDFRAALLNIFLIGLSVLIYYPFFQIYDKKLVAEEQEQH